MKILIIGDIVGSPGRKAAAQLIPRLREEHGVEFIVANAENAAGGRGITPPLCEELMAAGADILTLGDHVWDQRELVSYLDQDERVLRPANYAPACPGKGWVTLETGGTSITVINLVGRVFLGPSDCPFRKADAILGLPAKELGKIVVVDLHAEATSEKIAMGWHLDGRVSAVVGTHTHVQTSDNRVLPKGTAYITDLGMTGPRDSVLGRDKNSVLHKFITGMPTRFHVGEHDLVLEGVVIDVDPQSGRASSIERIRSTLDA